MYYLYTLAVAAELTNNKTIRKLENQLSKELLNAPRDISGALLNNIINSNDEMAEKIRKKQILLNYRLTPNPLFIKTEAKTIKKCLKLYIPKILTEVIGGISAGRT